ncbi:nuclear pore complex protein NUP1-like [Iris pallida]|uniref:Nuclear pore complex protein NUP1-like n=1 Tax=Iris pallida TaxID=29817 RepID=A0AAX6IDS3_IRIPA|nr:nuclear pore complex protein NUP1-like [Iris pallida]
MGMRPSKTPSSAVSLRNQVFREGGKFPSIPSASKSRDLSVAPRSTIRFSGIPEHTENDQTPRTLGRSAMYRMSRSPYFKVNSINTVKGVELNEEDYTYMSLSQWTPKSSIRSGGKQVLKRGSSVLDGDFGSVGPIRRIRQKCNLNSPSKDSRSPVSRSLLSSPLTPLSKQVIEGSTSLRKPDICKSRYGTTFSQAGGNGISNASVAPFPSRSSETAHKLFQQLDKLLPSPKERSSEMETVDRNEFPSKLSIDLLHGKARRSMEEIDTSKFSIMRGSDKLCTADDSHLPTPGSFSSGKMDMVEENGCSATFQVKLISETNGMKASTLSSDANSGKRCTYTLVSDSSVPRQSEKPGYHMCGPEGSLELDDEEYNIRNLASPLTKGKDGVESKIPESQNIISESGILEAALKIPKKNNLVSETAATEAKLKKPNHKEVVTETSISERPQQPPEPSLPTPLLNQLASQKEQTSPVLSSGSNTANNFAFSSTTATGPEMRHATVIAAEGSNLSKAGETQKAGDLFKPIGNAVSSGLSMSTTPALFAFGNSTAPSLCNGSPGSSSTPFSVSSTPGITLSGSPASSIPTSVTIGMPNSSPSLSSTAPIFPTVPSFQFGSGTTNASIPTPLDNNTPVLEAEPARTSFISNSSAQGTSLFPSMSSSSSTTTFTFSSSDSAPSALMMSCISSCKTSSSAALVTSSLFSSTCGSSSSLAPSSLFPSTGSSIFGFSGSSQSSSLSSSLANGNAQKSPTTFGATGGSIFGTQATHSGNGTSPISQSSTAHVSSFSSSPTFGLGNSSLSSFVRTPVGSATSGAKPFTPDSGFSISSAASSSASTSSSFVPSATSSLFGSNSQASTSSIFGSTCVSSTSLSTGFSFGLSALGSGSSASISNTSASTGYSFGLSAPGSGSSPFTFGSSSSSVFSVSSASSTASLTTSSSQPAFGLPNPAIGFSSATPASPGNDQMNVEDNMTDITNQAPSFLAFGQPGNQPATPSFAFGSPAVQPGGPSVFQFGSHQNPSVPQNPSPFQATGNSEFSQGGSFSVGSGGGDKSGRRIVRAARNKHRKK